MRKTGSNIKLRYRAQNDDGTNNARYVDFGILSRTGSDQVYDFQEGDIVVLGWQFEPVGTRLRLVFVAIRFDSLGNYIETLWF